MAAIEVYYVKHAYTLIIGANVEKSLHSIRISYPLDESDPVMGFGGLAYLTYSMDDAEWAAYKEANKGADGNLAYK